jgi:ribosome-binding protein aMBF1 (putative translation factor)
MNLNVAAAPLSRQSVKSAIANLEPSIDLADKLKMDVTDLMRQYNGHASPTKVLVKSLARELEINESYLEKLAEEVRKDLE